MKKKIFLVFLGLGLFLLAAGGSYIYFSLSKVFVKTQPSKATLSPTATPTPIFDPKAPYDILLLGYGGANHEGGTLTDTMIVTHVDPVGKKVTLISIPRDLWIPLPILSDKTQNFKINSAYAIGLDDPKYPDKNPQFKGEAGGGELAKYAAGVVSGMPINFFISIDFKGFTDAVDILGGIEANVPKTFDDYFYPVAGKENESCGKTSQQITALTATMSGFTLEKQFPCRYEHIHFDKGKNLMDGETALKFVRSRHSEEYGGDFARSERQSTVLTGVKEKVISLGIVPKAGPLFDKLVASVRTDMTPSVIREILANIGDPKTYEVSTIHLTEDNVLKPGSGSGGAYILLPREGEAKWDKIHEFISEQTASSFKKD